MPTRDEFLKLVDKFIADNKKIASIGHPPAWSPDRDGSGFITKFQLEVHGVQYRSTLVIAATPSFNAFRILVTYCDLCVARLDYDERQPHTNTLFASEDGLPPIVSGHHFHRWTLNKRFIDGKSPLQRLKHAEELPEKIRTFDAALRWFCDELNISLPHDHNIDYPRNLL